MSLLRFVGPALAAGVTAVTGCTVRTSPEPVHAATAVTSAPVQIETYPSTVYEGRTVYLYDDHWYYRHRGRWAYYRDEPRLLNRHRHHVHIAAPPPSQSQWALP